jgi:hypothetical protein
VPDLHAQNALARYLESSFSADVSSASDARHRIVLRREITGARDLRAAMLDLAASAAETRGDAVWILAARTPRMGADRVAAEWHRMADLLRPDLASRIGVLIFATDAIAVHPDNLGIRDKVPVVERELPAKSANSEARALGFTWTTKTFAVWHALLDAWLNAEDTLQLETLQRRSGCSYPTVRSAIDYLSGRQELRTRKDRSVAFDGLPRRSLEEVLMSDDRLRGTRRFVDATGARPDAERLLRKVLSRHPAGVQLGGVAAARHYVPDFDLNGLPRLDVTVTGSGRDAMAKLDPGLEPSREAGVPALVVVHEVDGGASTPGAYASAADTFLDLLDLRLTEQARSFAIKYRQLREERRG